MWFQTDQPGLYLGQCAEYCGTQHANMLLRVVVDPPADFERWLANEQKPAVDDPAARRRPGGVPRRSRASTATACAARPPQGTLRPGPDAPDEPRRRSPPAWSPNTPENLRRWVADPQQIKPGCLMPAFGLSDRDRRRHRPTIC